MGDPDFDNPIESTQSASTGSGVLAASPADIETLLSFGFSEAQASKALRSTDNNIERAAEWLFSHPDDDGLESASPAAPTDAANTGVRIENGADGKYELVGIISHLGRNTDCGHYVCHIKKNGKWAFFNDDKVAISENPPKDCGFMYLFKRLDVDGP